MGSRKSGWYRGRKMATDQVHKISVYDLKREGCLDEAQTLEYTCTDSGNTLLIRTNPAGQCLVVSAAAYGEKETRIQLYQVKAGSASGQGFRVLACCPRCGKGVAHIYIIYGKQSLIVGCRHCFDLVYRLSQLSRNWPDYYAYKMYKIEDKLGIPRCPHNGDDGFAAYFDQAWSQNVPSKMTTTDFIYLWNQLREYYAARVLSLNGQLRSARICDMYKGSP